METRPMLPVTIWMNFPSFHQNGLFDALAADEEVDVKVVYARQLTSDRLLLGWEFRVESSAQFLYPGDGISEALRIVRSQRDRFHIVGGMWEEPAFAAALLQLAWSRSLFAIYSEGADTSRGAPRWAWFRRRFAGYLAPRCAGVLAVSRLSTEWHLSLGFGSDKIYPFGYFLEDLPPALPAEKDSSRGGTEILFVGQLVPRKGLDLLINALEPLLREHANLCLRIVGAGPESASLGAQATSLGIGSQILLEGVLPAARVRQRIARADLLVLPSRWDGWGVVVNEALMVGVPVLVSDRVGAADLIQRGVNGFVFRSEDVADLRACLRQFLDCKEHLRLRQAALATGRCITANCAASYLIKCLRHMTGLHQQRPRAPWVAKVEPESAGALRS